MWVVKRESIAGAKKLLHSGRCCPLQQEAQPSQEDFTAKWNWDIEQPGFRETPEILRQLA
jgi:hypothetical protein